MNVFSGILYNLKNTKYQLHILTSRLPISYTFNEILQNSKEQLNPIRSSKLEFLKIFMHLFQEATCDGVGFSKTREKTFVLVFLFQAFGSYKKRKFTQKGRFFISYRNTTLK